MRYFSVVAIAVLAHWSGHARAQQDIDREGYYRAVEYCRGDVSRPMALSVDYPTLFKTKIVYETYPASQEEIASMVSKLHPGIRVIYDLE